MIASNIKKEIIKDWSNDFSELSVYSQNKLYKIFGAFVLGIEILRLPRAEDYRPVFVFYPLWKSDIKQCLDEPIFIQEIHNKKGFQFNIQYSKHHEFFNEAAECTKNQVSMLLQHHVSLQQLFEFIDKQFFQVLIRSSPVGQAKLYEGKLFAALYVNDKNAINQVLVEINKASMYWSPHLFEWKYGQLNVWLQSLLAIISNRDAFLTQIEANKQDKKIIHLKSSELTS